MPVIQVTKQDIKDGEGHNCTACPVANAIYRALPALGFPDHYVWVEPHGGFFSDPAGIEIRTQYHEVVAIWPVDDLPEELAGFAYNFDAWDDVKWEGWRAYKKRTGEKYRPDKPIPFEFALDLVAGAANAVAAGDEDGGI